jgi:hypothetical protein
MKNPGETNLVCNLQVLINVVIIPDSKPQMLVPRGRGVLYHRFHCKFQWHAVYKL